jgi:hypothetical protein
MIFFLLIPIVVIFSTEKSIQIGPEPQLFLDDFILEATQNITRRVNPVQKLPEPVLLPDKPWENNLALLFGSVIFDSSENIFKMWYYCDGGHVAYATSRDGLVWDKPELDGVHDGVKTNLVMEQGTLGYCYEIFGVLKDDRETDPARRYKAGFVSIQRNYSGEHQRFNPGQRRGLGAAVSPDGIHWTLEHDFLNYAICDISRFFWDAARQQYVLYGRTKLTETPPDSPWRLWGWGRAVTLLTSTDFRHWTDHGLMYAADADDPAGAEIYSMSVFPCAGMYLACVQMFYDNPDQGTLDMQLAVSRDGKQFTRVSPREPFIAEGKVGAWDRFNISLGNLPPVTVGDELWFYYSGRTCRHNPYKGPDTGPKFGAIGLGKIKRDRFLALEASFDSGKVVTRPFQFSGSNLCLNANCRFGTIGISLRDQNGQEIEGFQTTISGHDAVEIPIRFAGKELAQLRQQAVKIEVTLVNARFFGFQIQ